MSYPTSDIFSRMLAGGRIPFSNPEYPKIFDVPANVVVGGVPARILRTFGEE